MDGLKNGKPYFLMDDLGIPDTIIFGNIHISQAIKKAVGTLKEVLSCHWQPQLLSSSSLMFGLKYWILHRATLPSKMPVFWNFVYWQLMGILTENNYRI